MLLTLGIIYGSSVVISGIIQYINLKKNYEELANETDEEGCTWDPIPDAIFMTVCPGMNLFFSILTLLCFIDEKLEKIDENRERLTLEKENILTEKNLIEKNETNTKEFRCSNDFQNQIQELDTLLEQAKTKKEIKNLLDREKEVLKMYAMSLNEQAASLVELSESAKEQPRINQKKL